MALGNTPVKQQVEVQKKYEALKQKFVKDLPTLLAPPLTRAQAQASPRSLSKRNRTLEEETAGLNGQLAAVVAELETEKRLLEHDRARVAQLTASRAASERSLRKFQQQKAHKLLRSTVVDEIPLDQLQNAAPASAEPLFFDTGSDEALGKLKTNLLRSLIRVEHNAELAAPHIEKLTRVRDALESLFGDEIVQLTEIKS